MSQVKQQLVLAYVPVLQRGYLNFFKSQTDAITFFILGQEFLDEFEWLRKDLRALSPKTAAVGLEAILADEQVKVIVQLFTKKVLQELLNPKLYRLVMPNEDIMHSLAEKYLPNFDIEYIDTFLRWDSQNTLKQNVVSTAKKQPISDFSRNISSQATELATRSADWWRQVGAVVIRGNRVVLSAFNHHVPDEYQPLYQGDPRGNFKKGLHIELGTAIHAEAAIIAEAAKQGVSLSGCELYVTTFPCPSCAKLIAYSGITKLYYQDGYSMVDGESILTEKGVEIIQLT